jgi:hypothetical protein
MRVRNKLTIASFIGLIVSEREERTFPKAFKRNKV